MRFGEVKKPRIGCEPKGFFAQPKEGFIHGYSAMVPSVAGFDTNCENAIESNTLEIPNFRLPIWPIYFRRTAHVKDVKEEESVHFCTHAIRTMAVAVAMILPPLPRRLGPTAEPPFSPN
jgi:hypothetical protein